MVKQKQQDRIRTKEQGDDGRRPLDNRVPGGRKKSLIELRSYNVSMLGKDPKARPAEIHDVPGPTFAVREFILLRGIKNASSHRYRAVEIGNVHDAGDRGYSAAHRQPKPKRKDDDGDERAEPGEPQGEAGLDLLGVGESRID